jgi:hypothetical protein
MRKEANLSQSAESFPNNERLFRTLLGNALGSGPRLIALAGR